MWLNLSMVKVSILILVDLALNENIRLCFVIPAILEVSLGL